MLPPPPPLEIPRCVSMQQPPTVEPLVPLPVPPLAPNNIFGEPVLKRATSYTLGPPVTTQTTSLTPAPPATMYPQYPAPATTYTYTSSPTTSAYTTPSYGGSVAQPVTRYAGTYGAGVGTYGTGVTTYTRPGGVI
jgi:hypothetical protein